MNNIYDLLMIGARPGGYVAAKKAAKLGMSVVIIEKGPIGGTCINRGCIPMKALLRASTLYREILGCGKYGLYADDAGYDLQDMIEYKNQATREMRENLEEEFKELGIQSVQGTATVMSGKQVRVTFEDGSSRFYFGNKILIATGSKERRLDIPGADLPGVMTSEALMTSGGNKYHSLIVLGGGVTGDITGYAAATYLRGVDFIQIPTTLLAQCDSSIGGKTGVDFEGYKNMVGAFYMPKLVYMNVSVLGTLDDRQFYGGFAEVMKHGLIKDSNFYEWLLDKMYEIHERDPETMLEMVQKSCLIKKLVVEKDPTEKGDRALLNFGHTIGHAIEKAKNFNMTHGECVALGCVAAAYISWKHEWLSMEEYYEIRDMFVPFNLPITIEDIDPEEILALTKSDKKAENGSIKFVLLKKVGKAVIDRNVTDDDILNAVKEILYVEDENSAE